MLLLADRIRFSHPSGKLPVQIPKRIQAECVQVIARREGLDAQEARVIHPSSEHEMTHQIALTNAHRSE